jgi:hypothetical protein
MLFRKLDSLTAFLVPLLPNTQKQLYFRERFLLNSNAANTQDANTGVRTTTVDGSKVSYHRFLSPAVILPPRIFRVGGRFTF